MKVGFIGIGIMGSRMAKNLIKNNIEVIVYNRTKEKAAELIEMGAEWAESKQTLVRDSDIVYTMLSTPEVVKDLALGKDGFLNYMEEGKLWIDSTTVNPAFTKEMNSECHNKNLRFIDAPVAGSRMPAENGELIFLAGGDEKDIKSVEQLFDIMGKKTIHCGKAGDGSAMKMVVNSMLGASVACFSEAISLGKSMGLAENNLFDTLLATPVTAPILQLLRPKLEARNEDPNFPLKHMRKDLHLASLTAYEENVSLPIMNVIKEIYAQLEQNGKGDQDFSSIFGHIVKE